MFARWDTNDTLQNGYVLNSQLQTINKPISLPHSTNLQVGLINVVNVGKNEENNFTKIEI